MSDASKLPEVDSQQSFVGRWLLVGGAGYVGAHLAQDLATKSVDFVVLDNLSTGMFEALPPSCAFVFGDAADVGLVTQIVHEYKIDGVIYLAARKQARESVDDPVGYWWDNLVPMLATLKAIEGTKVNKFILSSSCSVYGANGRITDSSPVEPVSPYGRSKVASEWLLSDFARKSNLNWVALRYFNVIGNGNFPYAADRSSECIVPRSTKRIVSNLRPTIYGRNFDTRDGTALRDYIDVRDLSSAHCKLIEYMSVSTTYIQCALNVGTGRPISVQEIMKEISEALDWQGGFEYLPPQAGDPAEVWSEPSPLLTEIGWSAIRTMQESVESHCRSRWIQNDD